jgi:hypothetical protein
LPFAFAFAFAGSAVATARPHAKPNPGTIATITASPHGFLCLADSGVEFHLICFPLSLRFYFLRQRAMGAADTRTGFVSTSSPASFTYPLTVSPTHTSLSRKSCPSCLMARFWPFLCRWFVFHVACLVTACKSSGLSTSRIGASVFGFIFSLGKIARRYWFRKTQEQLVFHCMLSTSSVRCGALRDSVLRNLLVRYFCYCGDVSMF